MLVAKPSVMPRAPFGGLMVRDAALRLLTMEGPGSHQTRRHGRACPGHPRLDTRRNVDARHKAGHDDEESTATWHASSSPRRASRPDGSKRKSLKQTEGAGNAGCFSRHPRPRVR